MDDIRLKLTWATTNFRALKREIEVLEKQNDHTIGVTVDQLSGEYRFHVDNLPPLDPTWGLRIGDCLHAARTALDYIMVNLVAFARDVAPAEVGDVQFPVWPTPKQFNSAVGELRKEPILSGWLARVEELQPYNGGNPSIWGWSETGHDHSRTYPRLTTGLERLTFLDNVDKHRCILRPWLGMLPLSGKELTAPPEFKQMKGSRFTGPLTNGTEVGRLTYATPLSTAWLPSEAEMKEAFPLQVSFDEPSIVKSVIEIMDLCLWAASATMAIFEPVFERRDPPLPVTAFR